MPLRLERAQLALLGLLLALALVAWLVTDNRMGGMESVPGMDLGGLGFYVTVWVAMMAAMMFPSVAPTVLMYDRLRAGHRAQGKGAAPDATALFVAGYLCVWTGAGLAAYGLIELVRALDPAFLAWDEAGRYLTGGVIVAAAAYQLTPLKRACLVKCRSPMMFLAERWRHGRAGGLELGLRHGAWCLGCCWALMAALFAVGADEPRLDGADRRVHRRRKAAAVAGSRAPDRGRAATRARTRRGIGPRRRAGIRHTGRRDARRRQPQRRRHADDALSPFRAGVLISS